MRLLSVAALASVDGIRRKSSSKSAMRSDDQSMETQGLVNGPDERFENQIHEAKMSQIWWKVIEDQTLGPVPSVWEAALDSLSMMVLDDFFEYRLEEKPEGQSKVIHQQAVACKFSMNVIPSSPFTGIFAPGTTTGIMRMGPP